MAAPTATTTTIVFTGHSGHGATSVLNQVLGRQILPTGEGLLPVTTLPTAVHSDPSLAEFRVQLKCPGNRPGGRSESVECFQSADEVSECVKRLFATKNHGHVHVWGNFSGIPAGVQFIDIPAAKKHDFDYESVSVVVFVSQGIIERDSLLPLTISGGAKKIVNFVRTSTPSSIDKMSKQLLGQVGCHSPEYQKALSHVLLVAGQSDDSISLLRSILLFEQH